VAEIVFTADDLARTRIASEPSAEAEVLHSLHMLTERPIRCFAPWRRNLLGRLDRRVGALVGAVGGAVAGDRPAALGPDLTAVLDRYEQLAIAPYWNRIRTLINADRSRRARVLADGGMERLLATLHPAVRWRSPALQVTTSNVGPTTIRLDGAGLLLQPSVFVWHTPVLRLRGGRPVLLYPVSCEISGGEQNRPPPDLVALMGRARAAMLRLLVSAGATTTELALRTGLSLATISEHAGVLRDAGLITTRSIGRTRLHSLTPLGAALLGPAEDPGAGARAPSATPRPESG